MRGRANKWFLLALGAVALYLCYLIAKPFLGPIFAAIVLAIIFYPLYVRIESVTRRPNLAATISTILVIVVVAVPTLFLGLAITRELHELYRYLSEKSAPQGGVSSYLMNLLEASSRVLGRYVDLSHVDLRSTVLRWIDETARYLGAVGVRAASSVFSVILGIVAVFFTLFFLFRDAPKILQRVAGLVPLTVQQTARLGMGIKQTIVASVYGGLAVGLAQGSLTGIGFWAVGLPSPVLWGAVAAFTSLLPIVGTGLVWVPGAIVLIIGGHWMKALLLAAFGAAVVAQVDALIRPYVISGRANMSGLVIFFALLGGVQAFGLMGLFIGPVVVSVAIAVLDLLRETEAAADGGEPVATANE